MNHMMLNRAYENLWILSSVYIDADPMDSTPLNQAILAFDKVVNDFHRKHKLQVVSTIILTDGGSDGVRGYRYTGPELKRKPLGDKYVITDDVTKKTYWLSRELRSAYGELTTVFLNILKDRTNCNLIGFYLHGGNLASLAGDLMDASYIHDPKIKKSWKDDKFVGVTTAGYDEYYILNAREMTTDAPVLDIKDSMSKNAKIKEFIRFSGKKAIARVLLTRFIDRISTDKNAQKAVKKVA